MASSRHLPPIAFFAYKRDEHAQKALIALPNNVEFDRSLLHICRDETRRAEDVAQVEQTKSIIEETVSSGRSIVERNECCGLAESNTAGVSELTEQLATVILQEDDFIIRPQFLSYRNRALDLYSQAVHTLQQAGLANLEFEPKLTAQAPDFLYTLRDTNHQAGGGVMGESADYDAVNRDLGVFGTDNLFSLGASESRTSSNANTTLPTQLSTRWLLPPALRIISPVQAMDQVELQPMGRRVSYLGLGCGRLDGRIGLRRSARLLETALELGIVYFDAAESNGTAEEALGSVVGNSSDIVIAKKVGPPLRLPYSPSTIWAKTLVRPFLDRALYLKALLRNALRTCVPSSRRSCDFSQAAIVRSFETSFSCLRRDRVIVFVAHGANHLELIPEVEATFESLAGRGVVGAFDVVLVPARTTGRSLAQSGNRVGPASKSPSRLRMIHVSRSLAVLREEWIRATDYRQPRPCSAMSMRALRVGGYCLDARPPSRIRPGDRAPTLTLISRYNLSSVPPSQMRACHT